MTDREIRHFTMPTTWSFKNTTLGTVTKDVFTHGFTPKVVNYWVSVTGEISDPVAANTLSLEYFINGNSYTRKTITTEVAEWVPFSIFVRSDYVSTGEDVGLLQTSILAGGTTQIRNLEIHFIEKVSLDFDKEFSSDKSGVDTSYVTWDSLDIVSAGSGDYYLIAHALCKGGNNTDTMYIEITDGTTTWSETLYRMLSTTDNYHWAALIKITGQVGTKTYTVKVKCASGTGYYFGEGRIFAMAADTFDATYYNESRGRTITTSDSPTYVDAGASLTATPNQNEHLLIFCHANDVGSNGRLANTQIVEGATVLAQASTRLALGGPTSADHVFFKMMMRPLLNSSQTWKQQMCGTNVVVPKTVGVQDSAIALLQSKPTNARVNWLGSISLLGNVQLN